MPSPSNTTLLDDFNSYADGDLGGPSDITGGVWLALDPAASPLEVVSHQVAPFPTPPAGQGQSAWASTFGTDYDFIFDVPVVPTAGYFVIWTSFDRSLKNGYAFAVYSPAFSLTQFGSNKWSYAIARLDLNVSTVLTLDTTGLHTLAANEKVWANKTGTTLNWYWGTSGGVYTLLLTATDSTYSTGYAGPATNADTAVRLDNFRGGTVSATLSPDEDLWQVNKHVPSDPITTVWQRAYA